MTQVLYRKWRPMTFDQVVGQQHVTGTLHNALALGRVGHAYLFSGPRGTGKTTTARLLAKAVNCLAEELAARPCNTCRICRAINEGRFLDLIEIDAASNTGVDDVRDLREKIGFSPNEGRFKVYIVDEAHMLSTAAFNALLKTLEEPPPHAIFVLATTEAHKIPATVVSRCQRFEFRRIPLSVMVARLQKLLQYEGATAESAALDLIARQATGALRDAESLLDQVLSSQLGTVTLEQTQAVLGTASSEAVCQLVDAWIRADPAVGLGTIQRAVEAGADPQQFGRQTLDYLRGLLFLKTAGTVPSDVSEGLHQDLGRQAESLTVPELVGGARRFVAAAAESKGGWQPQLPLELAFVECVNERQALIGGASSAARDVEQDSQRVALRPPAAVAEKRKGQPTYVHRAPEAVQISAAQIQEKWNAVVAAVNRRDFRVDAMLRSGHGVLGLEGEVVVLGFKYGLHREKVESDEWRTVIEEALSEVMRTPLRIRCVDPQAYCPAPLPVQESGPAVIDSEEIKRFAIEELNAEVLETE